MLHHLGVETGFCNIEMVFVSRHKLSERRGNHLIHLLETLFACYRREPSNDMWEFEDKHVNMIVFNRYVAPTTAMEVYVAKHLSWCKGHIPRIIPCHCKVGCALTQVNIALALLSFCGHCQIICSGNRCNCCFFVFAICVKSRREIIALRYYILLNVVHCTLSSLQISFVTEILPAHNQCRSY